MKNEILTATGYYFDFNQPEKSVISIVDIGAALSKMCRFTGHCNYFYSVAQHSVLVSHIVPKEFAMQGLMHDAHEAYTGDMTTPLKRLIPEYQEIESRVEKVVRSHYELPVELDPSVKDADMIMLMNERNALLPAREDDAEHWPIVDPCPHKTVIPLTPEGSYELFMARYYELLEARHLAAEDAAKESEETLADKK